MNLGKYKFFVINTLIIILILTSYKESRVLVDTKRDGFIPWEYKSLEEVEIPIEYDTSLSPESLREVQNAVTEMPADVIKALYDSGWKVSVNYSIDGSGVEAGSVPGLCDFEKKTIYIGIPEEQSELPSGSYRIRTLHELSHFADMVYGFASDSDSFRKLYEAHKEDYRESGHADREGQDSFKTSGASELFASAMKDYIADSDYLRENYVDMYVYFRNLTEEGI